MDHQIKLRGFRIELGEIESVLGAHPEVQSCVVLLREDLPGDKRLCAYVVPKASCAPSLLGLRTYLGAKLPEYMIPADMVLLDDLPLNPNGKADRKALPAPSLQLQSEESEPPRTPVEQVVADVFAQILHMDRVGVHQNFFALGGHSLLATQVVSRISSALGLELPLRSLFDAPSVAALADAVAKLRGSASLGSTDAIAVLPREAATALPMSFAQQRLWFIEQLEPGNPVYVVPAAIRLRGPLQIDAMRRALACIASRHEALRTRFDSHEDQPVQIIDPAPDSWPLPIVEVRAGSDLSLEEQVARLAQAEARVSFDLRQGPLWRTSLLRLAADHHVLLLTMHHIISDGWSVGVLSRELSALYSAFLLQHPSPLPPLSVQLADVSSWERAQSAGPSFLAQLAYWQTQLQSCPPLELPTDRPRPPIFSYQGLSLPVVFPPALTTALKRLSTEHGATLFMTLLAAWNLLLSRFSGQTDLCVGTPIAHRNRTETEPLIGFFANTLVLRTKLDLDQTFSDLLAQVRKTCLESYANQDVPFERLVESLGVARDLSRNPLFQVMLVLQNEPLFALSLPDVVVEPLAIGNSTAKFDLILHLAESEDGGLCGVLEFARDLWDPATMHRLLGHLVTLLHAIVASPTSALHALPLLTSSERHQLLVEWNHTAADFPQDQCFPQLFEAQAARTPDAVALVFAEQQLTYRQLNARANQLAHHLLSQGVGPEVLVALCLERSLEMVIGMLGILKAGGAYVPIDPDYPQDRIDFLLSDAQPAVLVTKQALLPRFAGLSVPSVCLDQGPWDAAATSNPAPLAGMENLVYVLYTSGSTGRPKGVMIPHRALASLLVDLRTRFGLACGDVVLAVSPYTFDISVSELLAPLVQGATIVIAAREVAVDGPCLLELLTRSGASFLDATPTTYQLLFAAGWQGNSKMTLVCTGEAMPKQLAVQLAGCSAQVWNGYGPTEATVWASFWPVAAPVRQVLIGRPVANTQLFILDAHLHPVPIGVPGELHIGGIGLARGYLNRPELTAEKFIGNPFSAEPDSRLYKTGDLVRYLPDGNIEYLGRIDHQIKLRGHRIELGEVETALSTHAVVQACAVMVREDAPGVRQLVAYIVLQPDRTASIAILREHLLAKLPQYMVPATFVFLAALPLSANGKVDRKALPAPNQQRGEQEYLAPRSPLEGQLAELFATVLHLDRVSVNDNFFALGGDSLLAIQLVSRARRSGLVVAVRDLFMQQSVAELAAAIVQQTPLSCVAQLAAGKANGAVLFIPGSGGALYPAMVFAQLLGVQRPVLGLTTPPLAGTGPMPETLEALGAGYLQEIAARVPTGPLVLIGHSFGVHVALELGFQLQAAGRQIERVVLLDAGVPQLFRHLHYDPLILLGVYVQLLGLPLQPATLTDRTLAEALQIIVEAMTAAGLGDADPAAWLNAMLVSAEASHTMALHWSPRAPQAPIHLFRALEPNAELPDDVPEDFGWSAYFPLASLQFIPGGHVSLILPPHATTTAQAVAALLSDPSSTHADSHS